MNTLRHPIANPCTTVTTLHSVQKTLSMLLHPAGRNIFAENIEGKLKHCSIAGENWKEAVKSNKSWKTMWKCNHIKYFSYWTFDCDKMDFAIRLTISAMFFHIFTDIHLWRLIVMWCNTVKLQFVCFSWSTGIQTWILGNLRNLRKKTCIIKRLNILYPDWDFSVIFRCIIPFFDFFYHFHVIYQFFKIIFRSFPRDIKTHYWKKSHFYILILFPGRFCCVLASCFDVPQDFIHIFKILLDIEWNIIIHNVIISFISYIFSSSRSIFLQTRRSCPTCLLRWWIFASIKQSSNVYKYKRWCDW